MKKLGSKRSSLGWKALVCADSQRKWGLFPLDFLESASVIQCFSKQYTFNKLGFHKLISPLRVKMWICTAVYLVLFIHSSTFIEYQCAINYLRTWEQNRKSSSHQEPHVLVKSVRKAPTPLMKIIYKSILNTNWPMLLKYTLLRYALWKWVLCITMAMVYLPDLKLFFSYPEELRI